MYVGGGGDGGGGDDDDDNNNNNLTGAVIGCSDHVRYLYRHGGSLKNPSLTLTLAAAVN
jgi:hypothetical protein